MTQNVATRLDVKSKKSQSFTHFVTDSHLTATDEIPDGLFRQMTTCQTAANEFLRQFWLATYPPLGDFETAASPTPAQRAVKAAKMIGYISKTEEKVHALVQTAANHGIDPARVEIVIFLHHMDEFIAHVRHSGNETCRQRIESSALILSQEKALRIFLPPLKPSINHYPLHSLLYKLS